MILLLDTHVFLWWAGHAPQLKPRVMDAVSDPAHTVYVGAPSVWEIATKRRTGKLHFIGSPSGEITNSGFSQLPILPEDAEHAGDLDWSHKDPFDRLLVAQAHRLGATFVTADSEIRDYALNPILWAG